VLCSGGVYAAIDLSLYLVEKFCGREVALQCAKSLLVDMPRAHQSGYAVLPLSRPHSDERIRETEDYMARHYNRDLPLKLLSERASMSARTFLRRFKAATGRLPGQYLQAQRVAIARELLENTARPVQAISGAVGYDDIAFFRKLFRRETGMTPAEYRDRFGGGLIRRGTAPVERERLAYS
jgi:transcriptional regulator GlxA family with amidase domain